MKVPKFTSDEEAARFWESHEPLDCIDQVRPVERPRIVPSQAISLRLDPTILGLVRRIARAKGIGYQTLIKLWISEAVRSELDSARILREPRSRSFFPIHDAWGRMLSTERPLGLRLLDVHRLATPTEEGEVTSK